MQSEMQRIMNSAYLEPMVTIPITTSTANELDKLLEDNESTYTDINPLTEFSAQFLYCEFIPPELILADYDMIAVARLRRQYHITTKDVPDIRIVKDSLKWYRKHLFVRKNLSKYWNKAEESAYIKTGWITVEMKGKLMTHAGFWHWGNDYEKNQ